MKNKIVGMYIGHELFVHLDGHHLDPKHSQEVYNHSPDGFSAGYGGSGPAQLALAILLEVVGKEKALQHYHDFKFEFIANPQYLENNFFFFVDIKKWIESKE